MNLPIDLTETPGAVYALAYWFGTLIFIIVNRKKFRIRIQYAISGLFLVLLITLMTLNHPVPPIWFIPSILLYVFLLMVFMYVSINVPMMSIAYYTARAFIVGELIGSLSWQLFHFSIVNRYFDNQIWIFAIFIILSEFLWFVVLLMLERKFKEEDKNFSVSRRDLIATIMIVIVIFMVSNLSYVNENTPFSGTMDSEIFNVRTLVDFGGVALLFAFHIQIAELHMKFEVGKLQSLLKIQVENYEMSKKSIEMVNEKYHDLKHHIAVMKANATDYESIESLNQMEKEIKTYEAQNKTGNHVLDTILTVKSLSCQSNGTQLNVIANGKLLSMIDPIDISTLFGNLLDNAIESVKEIEDKEQRLIHLSISKHNQFMLIRLENPYVGRLKYKDGLPMTTKQDQMNHGYGLKSVMNTVKKYDGSLTINNDDRWFEVRVLIPLVD